MEDKLYQELRTRFLMAYANLPFSTRKEVIVMLGNEPVTWSLSFLEIKNETKKGKAILDALNKLGILNSKLNSNEQEKS